MVRIINFIFQIRWLNHSRRVRGPDGQATGQVDLIAEVVVVIAVVVETEVVVEIEAAVVALSHQAQNRHSYLALHQEQ